MVGYTLLLALGEERELVGSKCYLALQYDRGVEKTFGKSERYIKNFDICGIK
jgi:hypothetical protein